MLQGALLRWYHDRVLAQERTAIGSIVDHPADLVVHTDFHWLREIPSRFMAALIAQFLTGHFPTLSYLARFGHAPSPLCPVCQTEDTRAHMLLHCVRWAHIRQRLCSWLLQFDPPAIAHQGPSAGWTWEFLVVSPRGRLWLGRFLSSVRPRWRMQDQFQIAHHLVGSSSSEA